MSLTAQHNGLQSADRLYTAISNQTPDRVPVMPKLWVDSAARITDTDLIEVISNPQTAMDVVFEAGKMCGVDGMRLFHLPARKVASADGRVFEIDDHGGPIGEIDMMGGLSTHLSDPTSFNLEDPYFVAFSQFWTANEPFVKTIQDAKQIAVPDKKFYVDLGCADRQQTLLKKAAGKIAFIGDCGAGTLAFYVSLRGMQNAMLDLIENPMLVHRVMEKGVAAAIEKGKFNVDLGIKILRINDSVASMSLISPQHWREFIFPHIKTICDELHAYASDVKIYCHICGNVLPVAEDLVATGLDCIGPLDPLGGFSPADIKARVGNAVALMGGVNTLSFVDQTPEDIMEEARQCIQQAGLHGGYVLSSGCVVPPSSRIENLSALRTAAETYGIYKNGKLVSLL
jgi:uroporphyrinogen-III decarboxylase